MMLLEAHFIVNKQSDKEQGGKSHGKPKQVGQVQKTMLTELPLSYNQEIAHKAGDKPGFRTPIYNVFLFTNGRYAT